MVQSETSKWKRHVGWNLGGTMLQGSKSSPSGLTQDTLNSPSNALVPHVWNVFSQGGSPEFGCPEFLWRQFVGTFCFSPRQNPGLPQGRQGSFENRIVCTDSLGTVSHPAVSKPAYQMPTKSWIFKPTFPELAVSGLLC